MIYPSPTAVCASILSQRDTDVNVIGQQKLSAVVSPNSAEEAWSNGWCLFLGKAHRVGRAKRFSPHQRHLAHGTQPQPRISWFCRERDSRYMKPPHGAVSVVGNEPLG